MEFRSNHDSMLGQYKIDNKVNAKLLSYWLPEITLNSNLKTTVIISLSFTSQKHALHTALMSPATPSALGFWFSTNFLHYLEGIEARPQDFFCHSDDHNSSKCIDVTVWSYTLRAELFWGLKARRPCHHCSSSNRCCLGHYSSKSKIC